MWTLKIYVLQRIYLEKYLWIIYKESSFWRKAQFLNRVRSTKNIKILFYNYRINYYLVFIQKEIITLKFNFPYEAQIIFFFLLNLNVNNKLITYKESPWSEKILFIIGFILIIKILKTSNYKINFNYYVSPLTNLRLIIDKFNSVAFGFIFLNMLIESHQKKDSLFYINFIIINANIIYNNECMFLHKDCNCTFNMQLVNWTRWKTYCNDNFARYALFAYLELEFN